LDLSLSPVQRKINSGDARRTPRPPDIQLQNRGGLESVPSSLSIGDAGLVNPSITTFL
jgi:hypothetical protein